MERRLIFAFSLVLLVALVGIAWYWLVEGWTPLEAFYMTVITLSTVGYREVRDLDESGIVFTTLLIIFGVGTCFYALTTLAEYIVLGELRGTVRRRQMEARIRRLRDHAIICGLGRVGQQVAVEAIRQGISFVAVDSDPGVIERCVRAGYLYVQGDAGEDATLQVAGIANARALFACVNSDAANIYVTLSARGLRQDLFIVARADLESTEAKLYRAGANRVVSPYALGGRRMATLATRPLVADFLDSVMHSGDMEYEIEEIVVGDRHEPLTVGALRSGHPNSVLILAVAYADGKLLTQPPDETALPPGSRLIAFGTEAELAKVRGECAGA